MKFYLGNRDNEVQVEINPQLTETLDESLDSASVVLKVNDIATPYSPNTKFLIDMENQANDVFVFLIDNDVVETFSTKPLLYKHTLTLTQNINELKKHLVRNSVFSINPFGDERNGYYAIATTFGVDQQHQGGVEEDTGKHYQDVLFSYGNSHTYPTTLPIKSINVHSKVSIVFNAYIFYLFKRYGASPTVYSSKKGTFENVDNINEYFASGFHRGFRENNEFTLKYKDISGINRERQVFLEQLLGYEYIEEGKVTLNKEYVSGYINSLIEQGCTDFVLEGELYYNAQAYTGSDNEFHVISQNIEIRHYKAGVKTCYEILEQLLQRQSAWDTEGLEEPLFKLPDEDHYPELEQLLKNTDAPNFVFTQATMFECVAEVFRLFDATFTIDEEGYINIEYLNEKKELVELNGQMVSINKSLSAEKFTNGIVAHYQDARTLEVFPDKNGYCLQRSEQLGVANDEDHNILLPHTIDSIKKVKLYVETVTIFPSWTSSYLNHFFEDGLDITRFCVEESVWALLSTTNDFPQNNNYAAVTQNNTIKYVKGTNRIELVHKYKNNLIQTLYSFPNLIKSAMNLLFGIAHKSDPEFDPKPYSTEEISHYNARMNVEYYTSVDGKTRVESLKYKYNGEALIDQNNGAIDLNRMGLNMLGIAMKTGEPEITITKKLSSWADRIQKGAYTSDGYVANVINFSFLSSNLIQERITFVKNFNALSQRIRLLKEKRLSNISGELTVKSEEIIMEYLYISSSDYKYPYIVNGCFSGSIDTLANMIAGTFDGMPGGNDSIDFATFYCEEESKFYKQETSYTGNNEIYLPMIKYGAGNCICFEVGFDHPINAGNESIHGVSGWFGNDRWFTRSSIYTNEIGEFQDCRVYFYKRTGTQNFGENFPNRMDSTSNKELMTTLYYRFNKQPNEIFAMNYELCVLALDFEKEFIGNKFINDNGMLRGYDKNKKFYLYYSNELYDVLDKKALGNEADKIPIVEVDYTTNRDSQTGDYDGTFEITFMFGRTKTIQCNSWCIADESGDIYFASNKGINSAITGKTIKLSYTGRYR